MQGRALAKIFLCYAKNYPAFIILPHNLFVKIFFAFGIIYKIKRIMLRTNVERRLFMSKNKKKIRKLTDEQYNEYIAGLKDTAPLFSADGSMLVPDVFERRDDNDKEGE